MTFSFNNKFGKYILSFIQKHNHSKYWSRREKVINPQYRNSILKLYYLYYIKKTDAYHNCSFGTNYNSGAIFKSPPHLPHGPKGIIVGHNVTIAHGGGQIGDHVLLSTGSVVLPGKTIGDNAKIGANAVVVGDVPDGATLVLNKPRMIVMRDRE